MNIARRHRHGKTWQQVEHDNYAGPLTLREFKREANWTLIFTLLALTGFWCWVGYNVAQWLP